MIRAIGYELLKLKSQKKNYVMLFGHLGFYILSFLAYRTNRSGTKFLEILKRTGFDMDYIQFITSCLDGPFFARMVMIPVFVALLPIAVATLAGDCIAGEVQDGSMKLFLARPRSRTWVVFAKFFAIYLVTFMYSVYFAVSTMLISIALLGFSPVQVIFMFGRWGVDFTLMTPEMAFLRYGMMTVYFSFSLMALAAIAIFLSTWFNRMTTATIVAITVYFVSYIVAALPFAEPIKPFMISEIMGNGSAFMFWMTHIPLIKLIENLAVLGCYICGFLTLAVINFNCKDIK